MILREIQSNSDRYPMQNTLLKGKDNNVKAGCAVIPLIFKSTPKYSTSFASNYCKKAALETTLPRSVCSK